MPIAIDPLLTAGSTNFNYDGSVVSSNLCKQPYEGLKYVPLQVITPQVGTSQEYTLVQFVDLSVGVPPPLSQVCSMYVNARDSIYDVTVLFPDTGFQVTVSKGNGLLFPILTGTVKPQFYVIFNRNEGTNGDANGVTPTVPVPSRADIFVINQFIPEFGSEDFSNSVQFVTGSDGELQPVLAPGYPMAYSVAYPLTGNPGGLGIDQGDEYHLTGIKINAALYTTDGSTKYCTVQFYDNWLDDGSSTGIFLDLRYEIPLIITPTIQAFDLLNVPKGLDIPLIASDFADFPIQLMAAVNLNGDDGNIAGKIFASPYTLFVTVTPV